MVKRKLKLQSKLLTALLPAGLILPLELSQWKETSFPFKSSPDFTQEGKSLRVATDDDVGGYFFPLSEPRLITDKTRVMVNIKVDKFPKVKPVIPYDKKQDDYALRIGLVVGGGPEAKLPSAVKSRLKLKYPVSNMLYLNITDAKFTGEACGKSPHNDYSVYCGLSSDLKGGEIHYPVLAPLKRIKKIDYQGKLLGVWLFADTDDSDSESNILIRSIKIND